MSSQSLPAPWRIEYIRSLEKPEPGCFLCNCAAAACQTELCAKLVLWMTELTIVGINKYPYTNGHLLISPRAHKADLEELTPEELADLQTQTVAAIKLLKRAISPQGFNVGINLGKAGGAGVPGHLHQHVVPRWNGDTNFISVIGETRIVPQATHQLYEELMRLHAKG